MHDSTIKAERQLSNNAQSAVTEKMTVEAKLVHLKLLIFRGVGCKIRLFYADECS